MLGGMYCEIFRYMTQAMHNLLKIFTKGCHSVVGNLLENTLH